MTPVALTQDVEQAMATWTIERLEDLDTEGDPAGVADTRAEVSDKNNTEKFTVEIDGEKKEFTAEEIVAMNQRVVEADAAKKKAEEDAAEKAAEAKAKDSTIESLTQRVDKMEADSAERDFTELFSQAQREGRVDTKDETRATWLETFKALGAEKMKTLLNQVPAETIPFTAQGRSGDTEQSTVPAGQHPESFKLNQRVEAYMREHPEVDFDKALDTVRGEMAGANS